MPSASAPGFLLDAFGRPATFGGAGNLYRRSEADNEKRERPRSLFGDYLTLLSPARYRELVNECRHLASRGLVHALLEQKADYVAASHFRPTFTGADEAYGVDLIDALEESFARCNLRGPRFDWRTTWRLGPITRATDGSYFILLTQWADGWPALQVFEGHRIWQRDLGVAIVGKDDAFTVITDDSGATKKVRGAYRGLKISQGIIYNEAGQEVAYRLLGPADDGSEDQDISARDMIHVSRPSRFSEGRPTPDLASAALDFLALDLAQTAQLDQQIIDAQQTVVESNATGKAPYDAGLGFGNNPASPPPPSEVYVRGQTRFIKSGFELKPWQTARPSDQWMNFDMRVASRAAASIRWRLEMLDPAALRGAANRALQDQINTSIQDEFSIDSPAAIRVCRYFAAKLVQVGRLANHKETRALGISPPQWFEVDRASAKYDLEDVAAGRISMSTLHQRDGTTTDEVYQGRILAYERALAMQKQHPKVPLEIILGDQGFTAGRTGYYPQQDPIPDPSAPQPPQGSKATSAPRPQPSQP